MRYQDVTGKSIQEQFEVFHRDNPHIYAALVKIGRELFDRGHMKFNLEICWDRLRWLTQFERPKQDDDTYKLNDIYVSRYARLIMAQEPDFAGVFSLRKLRS
jgi:hypothetical protein